MESKHYTVCGSSTNEEVVERFVNKMWTDGYEVVSACSYFIVFKKRDL